MEGKRNLSAAVFGFCIGVVVGCFIFDLWVLVVHAFSYAEKAYEEDIYDTLFFLGYDSVQAAWYGLIIPIIMGPIGAIFYSRQKKDVPPPSDALVWALIGAALICVAASIYWCGYNIFCWHFNMW